MVTTSNAAALMPPVPDTAAAAPIVSALVVSLAETVGLVPQSSHSGADRGQTLAAFDAFAREGVGRTAAREVHDSFTAETVSHAGTQLLEAVQQSPMPHREWEPMSAFLGDRLLAILVDVSEVSLRRYRNEQRVTPDDVAARLHHITLLVAYLAGSYNAFGIRRWFQRSRTGLGNRSPVQVLSTDWDPDDPDVRTITSLATSLLQPAAA
jgi:hypothetical protein